MKSVLIDSSIWIDYFKSGKRSIGIPDIIIAQNAKQHDLQIYSLDKHYQLINQVYKLRLYEPAN